MNSIKSSKLFSWVIERKLVLFIIAVSVVALVLPGAFVFATENDTDEAQQPAVPAAEEQATPVLPTAEEEAAPATEASVVDEGVVIVTGDEPESKTEESAGALDEGVVIVTGDEPEATPEETAEAEVVEQENGTVTGTVKTSDGKTIPADKNPYVQIAGVYTQLLFPEAYSERVTVSEDGSFTINDVPEGLSGIITAGANGYSNQILAYPGKTENASIDFTLDAGSTCTFTKDKTKLGSYYLHEGSFFKPLNGDKIEFPSLIGTSISLGTGMPDFGLPAGATITENLDYGTITYYYKNEDGTEEHKLILSAAPESGYQFNYWEINGEPIPEVGYKTKAGTPITLNPVFTEVGKMIVGGTVIDKDSGNPIENAFGYIFGYDIYAGVKYVSEVKMTGEDGIFLFNDVPDSVKGVLIVGAEGHASELQYLSYFSPRTEFKLNPGVICKVDKTDEFGGVRIEAGSKIKFVGEEEEFVFPIAIDLGNDLPPVGFANDTTAIMDFKTKGILNFKFDHGTTRSQVESVDINLKAYGKTDYAFKNWMVDGKDFSGPLELSKIKGGFTVKPIFKKAAPYTFRTYIKNRQDERIANAYAYLVGMYESTGEVYLSDVATTDIDGVFAIENIPYDVSGIVVVGAPGYVNRFDYCDCDVDATFFTLDEGVQISIQMPDTASTVYIEKGTSVKLTAEGIPIEFTLPYDIEFGNYFLPFGITPRGTFNFMEDGRVNYTVTNNENVVEINSLSITFRVAPKDGYVFTGWLKDGQPISGEYNLQTGEEDFTIAPVFEVPVPPQPSPVDPTITPTGMAKTFDSIEDWCVALAILFAAFMVVYTTRKFVFKK